MKPSKKLIKAFRNVAEEIRNGDEYNWNQPTDCNCGLLARKLGVSRIDIAKSTISYWTKGAQEYCEKTNFRINDIVGTLIENGISLSDIRDIRDIEFLEINGDVDVKIAKMYNLELCEKEDEEKLDELVKEYAFNWFLEKANLMEAQLNKEKESVKVVSSF